MPRTGSAAYTTLIEAREAHKRRYGRYRIVAALSGLWALLQPHQRSAYRCARDADALDDGQLGNAGAAAQLARQNQLAQLELRPHLRTFSAVLAFRARLFCASSYIFDSGCHSFKPPAGWG